MLDLIAPNHGIGERPQTIEVQSRLDAFGIFGRDNGDEMPRIFEFRQYGWRGVVKINGPCDDLIGGLQKGRFKLVDLVLTAICRQLHIGLRML